MVQPVEIVDTLSKTELASKLNQMKKASSEMEQRQFTKTLKDKTSAETERTNESMKSDLLIITKDKQEQEEKRQGQRKKKDETSHDNNPEQTDGSHLDVKI